MKHDRIFAPARRRRDCGLLDRRERRSLRDLD
jgi:hypothetical protein